MLDVGLSLQESQTQNKGVWTNYMIFIQFKLKHEPAAKLHAAKGGSKQVYEDSESLSSLCPPFALQPKASEKLNW